MRPLLAFLLCASAQSQGFTLRDVAFVGQLTKPASGGPANPVFNNVTHVWHLEEASGNARADSKGSATLSETGGTVSQTTGVHNNAAHFTSVNHLQTASGAAPASSVMSVALWIKIHTRPAAGDTTVYLLNGGDDPEFVLSLNSGGTMACGLTIDDSGGGISSVLSLDAWHLVVMGLDPFGDAVFYVDNVNVFNQAGQSHTLSNDQVILNNGWTASSDFTIDEVMVFSVVLSAANVATLWNSGAGTFYP